MLKHRQEFNVCESHARDMRRQPRGQLAIRQQAVALATHPRAQVHLVHQHRLAKRIGVGALCQPRAILPGIRAPRLHNGRMSRPLFHHERVRVRFHTEVATR